MRWSEREGAGGEKKARESVCAGGYRNRERLRKLIANVKSINTSYIFVIDLFLNLI